MAGSLIVPMTVSAKVLKAEQTVPDLLNDLPFVKTQKLQAGVHLHWSLPDSLTQAKVIKTDKVENAIFPGVPDLWLVLRLNQAPPIGLPEPPKLKWKAWVVDSIAGSSTELDLWNPPTNRDIKRIHTMAGVLDHAADMGHKGYGLWDKTRPKFDPAVAAYYPACRTRLGFYDSLADIPKTGKISYTVIGWYSLRDHDPLYMSLNRTRLLRKWKFGYTTRAKSVKELATSVVMGNSLPSQAWAPATIQVAPMDNPSAARIGDVKRNAMRGGSRTMRFEAVKEMQRGFPVLAARPDGPVQEVVDSLLSDAGPKDILCHGSVLEVNLGGPGDAPVNLTADLIKLYPTVKRALADVAANTATDPSKLDFVEMMLDDLDSLKNSVAGIVDLPGSAHSLTFQGVPGKARTYMKVDVHPKQLPSVNQMFANGQSPYVQARQGTGHWPQMQARSASVSNAAPSLASVPAALLKQPAPSPNPTPQELETWRSTVRLAFNSALAGAASPTKDLDPRLVRVQDYRGNAQPLGLGRSADGSGTDGGGSWFDINDDAALNELYKSCGGAIVHLPDPKNLYDQPGPRWYRPWSPQVVLTGTGRSYKFGEDGRFRPDRFTTCRVSGEVTTGLSVGNRNAVFGKDVMETPTKLFSRAGLPLEAQSLVNESVLVNPQVTSVLASLAVPRSAPQSERDAAQKQYQTAIRGIILSRDPRLPEATRKSIFDKVLPWGDLGAAEGTTLWSDPRDPLFLDAHYSHLHCPLATHWKLKQDWVECTRSPEPPAQPLAPTKVSQHAERTYVTASVAKILESSLITKKSVDMEGNLIQSHALPKGLKEDTFQNMDVLSAPLTMLEKNLYTDGSRERSGSLRLNKLRLVDMFGMHRDWNSGLLPGGTDGGPNLSYWTELTPRLPYWSRVQFRLQSAANNNVEASPVDPPVCGLLVPDFMEHAVEVFDADGQALGQLTSNRPQFGSGPQGATLNVEFKLHPWVAQKANVPETSTAPIVNARLRSLVDSLVQQKQVVAPNRPQNEYFETGLTAMLRVIDTVRGTLDPSVKTRDRKTHLIGEPIMLLAGRLLFEAADINAEPKNLSDGPQLQTGPALPKVPVRIGDVTRPDDGVLGCFVPAEDPVASKFMPVSTEAASKAIFNGLVNGSEYQLGAGRAVTHPFIDTQESRFDLQANVPKNIFILADVRGGGLYSTSGVLPRKKLTVPKEFLDPALAKLEPTFRVGPILTFPKNNSVRPVLPPPEIEGMSAEFVFQEPNAPQFDEVGVPPAPPVSELPAERVRLHEGWVRMFKSKTS